MLYLNILAVLQRSNLEQLKRKNNKLGILSLKVLNNRDSSINLSSQVLDTKPIKYRLHQNFIDENKFVKRNVAVELEALGASLDHYVQQSDREAFHEYLRLCTNIIKQKIYTDKDDTFTSLQNLRKNKDIVTLSADKESCTVILNKSDYVFKVDQMIEDGITEGKYIETSDNAFCDLKRFGDILYRHLYKHKDYEAIRPCSNQADRFIATAKTHKFKSIEDIYLESLKLRPIIHQTRT